MQNLSLRKADIIDVHESSKSDPMYCAGATSDCAFGSKFTTCKIVGIPTADLVCFGGLLTDLFSGRQYKFLCYLLFRITFVALKSLHDFSGSLIRI